MLVNEWIDKDSMEKISIEQISTDYLSFETTRIYVTFNIDAIFILPHLRRIRTNFSIDLCAEYSFYPIKYQTV